MHSDNLMEFIDSFEKVRNRIRSFKEVDKARFWVNGGKRVEDEFLVLWEINSILTKDNGRYAIQCECGRLDVIDERIFNIAHKPSITNDNPTLSCSLCKKLKVGVDAAIEVTLPL